MAEPDDINVFQVTDKLYGVAEPWLHGLISGNEGITILAKGFGKPAQDSYGP